MIIRWAIVVVWLAGTVASGVVVARGSKERTIKQYGIEHATKDQGALLFMSLLLGTAWPLWVPVWLVLFVTRGRVVAWLMRTDLERRHAEREELAKLRAQAQAYGLPYPREDES